MSKLSPLNLNILQPKKLNSNLGNSTSSTNLKSLLANNGSVSCIDASFFKETSLVASEAILPSLATPRGNGLPAFLTLSLAASSGSSPTVIAGKTGGSRRGVHTMAKRNARERNRVKLVNQGFHKLRQHIPEDFCLKKMSKVDTLRCALDYIRSLGNALDISSSSSGEDSFTLIDDASSDETSGICVEEYEPLMSSGLTQQHLDSICNNGINISSSSVKLVESGNVAALNISAGHHHHHLLLQSKLCHPGFHFHESENKQNNGAVTSASFLNPPTLNIGDGRIKKENEEYIMGLSQDGENEDTFTRHSSIIAPHESLADHDDGSNNNSNDSMNCAISVDENYNGMAECEQNFIIRHSSM